MRFRNAEDRYPSWSNALGWLYYDITAALLRVCTLRTLQITRDTEHSGRYLFLRFHSNLRALHASRHSRLLCAVHTRSVVNVEHATPLLDQV